MAITTSKLPTMHAMHIKTAIVTSMPTCNGVRPRGSSSNSWMLLVFLPWIFMCVKTSSPENEITCFFSK